MRTKCVSECTCDRGMIRSGRFDEDTRTWEEIDYVCRACRGIQCMACMFDLLDLTDGEHLMEV